MQVFHDCREDSAALYRQHNIRVNFVFDTQAAHQLICLKKGIPPYQASLRELLQTYLGITVKGLDEGRSILEKDSFAFSRRPVDFSLLLYAALGVKHLVQLALAMSCHIDPEEVIKASEEFTMYRHLNEGFTNPNDMKKIGTVLEGLVVVRTPEQIIFKLNTNATGIVCAPSTLKRFQDVNFGDVVTVSVVGESAGGKYLYLDRHDGVIDYADKNRPRHRYNTSMKLREDSRADPLLLAHLDE
ncbi:hypothetical protein, conserved [Eimeria maxima]|uniref:3'-5' exonuclease domain-containing protein n=1 Tax=Eimeria maxima TaxID=5804 RepID=U6MF30_EIMMA|nr:hypothetical protein, conserved [Eimeria maxima]CDJ61044.1 hypothetical protein, conserved [Eimeria maxima]